MRLLALVVFVALMPAQGRPRRPVRPLPPRAICVAPHVVDTPTSAGNLPQCPGAHYALKIDDRDAVDWPRSDSLKVEGLDAKARHRVVIQCDGQPHQSFRFTFSEFKSPEPCLFLNDLYKTAQLWESKRAPWCSCQ